MPVDRSPVMLLPGAFGQDVVYWNLLSRYLRKRGYATRTVTFPTLSMADLRDSSRSLRDAVEELRDSEGASTVHLVGHSMGGLIARYYVQVLDGHRATASLSCLATPHQGTWVGLTAPIFTGCRQILPGSAFIEKLAHSTARLEGLPVLNVWSRADVVVVPGRSAVLEAPGVTNRCATFTGHWAMLVSPFVFSWVRDHLDETERLVRENGRDSDLSASAAALKGRSPSGRGEAAPG